jgi:hypothetical protein
MPEEVSHRVSVTVWTPCSVMRVILGALFALGLMIPMCVAPFAGRPNASEPTVEPGTATGLR